MEINSRTIPLIGSDRFEQISQKKVIIFGIGGVGAAVAEALVRFGLKEITLVDYDTVSITNLNRQVFTNQQNIGMYKCLALRDYLLKINPKLICHYQIKRVMYNLDKLNLQAYDYVVDAVDSITAKVQLAKICYEQDINFIASMGTGNRLDPTLIQVMKLKDTSYDPMAKILRRELKRIGITDMKVVCSKEMPKRKSLRNELDKRSTPTSVSFVPPVAGYIIASDVIKTLGGYDE